MSGKSGGGARTPTIERNTLHGAQKLKFIDLISSGEIFGFKHGNDEALKSILLNGTPIQNQDNSLNFNGVRVEYNRGTHDQDYLPSFSTIDRAVGVNAQVKKNTPITRTVSNKEVTSVRVTVGVDALMRTTKEGGQLKTSVSMSIMLMKNNVIHSSKVMTLNEKGSKPFRLDFEFDDLPEVPFEIRCVRNTADSNDDMLRNNTYFFSYVESIDAKMRYPLSAVAAMEIDSEQFGNDNPERTYDLRGVIVQVPSNYDPETREYKGLWDRLFKPAWTNNPVWILYDLLTDEIDGFNAINKGIKIDIDNFYSVAKYCDELVDDGNGGKEPRFVCNAVFYGEDAYTAINNLCSSFRAVCGYNGEYLTLYTDRAHDVVRIYNNSMVVDGTFNYSETELSQRYNQVQVQYVDENNGYETTIDEVSDDAQIATIERIITLSIVAFGATKLSYARRAALWALITSLTETVLVSFKVGASGIYHEIYDIIEIVDNDYMGTMAGGRIKAINGNVITLDREVNDAIKFSIETKSGPQNFDVKRQISETEYELALTPEIIESASFNAILKDVEPRLFRCTNIEENDDGTYTVSAIQHNSQKEAIVDRGAQYMPESNTTIINSVPGLSNGIVNNDGRAIILEWDSLSVIGTENRYRVQLFKDRALYKTFETKETSLRLENLPQGEYIAKIRAVNSNGQYSEELVIAFSTTYIIDGLRAKPIVFGIELRWQLPALITSDASTEIWYSTKEDRMTATRLAVVPYPQSNYTFNGLSVGDAYYFWFRLVDRAGNDGEFSYSILGKPSDNSDDILGYLDGKISEKQISKELQDQFDKNIHDRVDDAKKEIQKEIDGIEVDLTGINSEIDNIKTDITSINSELDAVEVDLIGINSEIETVKTDADKALKDAEKNAQDIKDQTKVIDEVKVQSETSEALWQLAQMSNISAQRSEFARSMSLSGQVGSNIANIEELYLFRVTDQEAVAFEFKQMNTRVDDAESKITETRESLSNEIKAEASKREALEAEFDVNTALQQLSSMMFATSDKSLSSRLFSLSASTANAHARYDALQEVVATNEEARVNSEQRLQAQIGTANADIQRIDRVMTSEFASQANTNSELSASIGKTSAALKEESEARVERDKAQAQKNETIETNIEESKAIQQLASMSHSSAEKSFSQRYFMIAAQTANSSAKIEELQKIFTDSNASWAISERHLQSQIDASRSELSRIEKVSNEREVAQAATNEKLNSEIGKNSAEIKKANESIVNNEKSQAKLNESFESKFDDNEASQQLSLLMESGANRSLSHRYFSLSAQTANSAAKLEALQKVFTDSETAWALTEQRLQSQIDTSKAEISRIDKAQVEQDKAQTATSEKQQSEINDNKAQLKTLNATVVDNKKAQTLQNTEFESEFADSKASQQLAQMTQSSADKSLSQSISIINAQTANNTASIQRVDTALTTHQESTAESIKEVSAKTESNTAKIIQNETATASVDGRVNALWTLKVDANGAIGGIMLGSDGKESQFKVAADTFVVSTGDQSVNMFTMQQVNGKTIAALNGDLIAKGSISGDKIVANTAIQAPVIKGGRIESGHIAGGQLNIGNGNCTIKGNGDFYAKNGQFEGTVYADKIEGDVVSHLLIKSALISRGGIYRFTIPADKFDRILELGKFACRSWMAQGDRRAFNPTMIVKLGGTRIFEASVQTISFTTWSAHGNDTQHSFRYDEPFITDVGFSYYAAVCSQPISVELPKNKDAEFEVEFYVGGRLDDSFAISEIPATIYRKSRVTIIYPVT